MSYSELQVYEINWRGSLYAIFELLYTRIRRRYNKDEVLTKGSDHARVHAPSAISTSKLMLSNSRRLYDEFIYRNRNRTSINTDTILHTIVY